MTMKKSALAVFGNDDGSFNEWSNVDALPVKSK